MRTSKLGTSLENLLARHKPAKAAPVAEAAAQDDEILHIPVADVKPNPSQPRVDFREDAFQELVLNRGAIDKAYLDEAQAKIEALKN